MDEAAVAVSRAAAIAVLGAGLGLFWLAVTIFFPSVPASAAEDPDDGLLGAVHGVVSDTSHAAASVSGVVDEMATEVVATALPVVAPVVEVVPAGPREDVVAAIDTATNMVSGTADVIDATLTATVDTTAATVEAVTADTPLAGIVGAAAPLDGILPPLPLSPLEEAAEALTPSGTAPTVPGTAATTPRLAERSSGSGDSLSLVTSAERMLRLVGAAAAATVDTAASAMSATAAGAPSFSGWPLSTPPSGSGVPAGAGAIAFGAAALAAILVLHPRAHLASRRSARPRSSTPPGAPVYDTDTSPD